MVYSEAGQARPRYANARARCIFYPRLQEAEVTATANTHILRRRVKPVALMVFSSGLSGCSCIGDAQHSQNGSFNAQNTLHGSSLLLLERQAGI
jgi:hypothetical protein